MHRPLSSSLALAVLSLLALPACATHDDAATPTALAAASTVPAAPTLAGADLAHWSQLLEPAAEDTAWLDIPWHASFHDGLQAAAQAERPLLLWLMNGHPLGCT